MISDKSVNLSYEIKKLNTLIAMLTEDKVTEIFVMADEFCNVFETIFRRRCMAGSDRRGSGNTIVPIG